MFYIIDSSGEGIDEGTFKTLAEAKECCKDDGLGRGYFIIEIVKIYQLSNKLEFKVVKEID